MNVFVVGAAIDQDEDDIFQCGKCKSQFTSLHLFVLHKREHTKVPERSVDLSQYLVSNDSHVVQTDDNCQDGTRYNPDDGFEQTHELGEPIILEENDLLFRWVWIFSSVTKLARCDYKNGILKKMYARNFVYFCISISICIYLQCVGEIGFGKIKLKLAYTQIN